MPNDFITTFCGIKSDSKNRRFDREGFGKEAHPDSGINFHTMDYESLETSDSGGNVANFLKHEALKLIAAEAS